MYSLYVRESGNLTSTRAPGTLDRPNVSVSVDAGILQICDLSLHYLFDSEQELRTL